MKKKILIFVSSCAFAALMLFNVSVSMENTGMETDISLSGIQTLASSGSENCHSGGYCEELCGPPSFNFCTAMDCGSGTQFCHRY
ncbi:MAG: hypothetical protein JJU13_04980 [Balneolaceae bacterium]|nr:hypothetical protein [Balneolaceae bacterium]